MFFQIKQISLDGAKVLAAAAEAEAIKNGWKIGIAIADAGGNPIYVTRMDGSLIASYQGALMKAGTAVRFGRDTSKLEESVSQGRLHYFAFSETLPVTGGMPIVIDGVTIGGIGIGGTNQASQSSQCATAAILAFNQSVAKGQS